MAYFYNNVANCHSGLLTSMHIVLMYVLWQIYTWHWYYMLIHVIGWYDLVSMKILRLVYDTERRREAKSAISALDYHVHTSKHTRILSHQTATLLSMTRGHLKRSLIELRQSCLLITGLKVSIYLYSLVLLIAPKRQLDTMEWIDKTDPWAFNRRGWKTTVNKQRQNERGKSWHQHLGSRTS